MYKPMSHGIAAPNISMLYAVAFNTLYDTYLSKQEI